MNSQRIFIAVFAVIGLVGCFFPWYTINLPMNIPFFGKTPFGNGMNVTALGYGWIILAGYIACFILAIFTQPKTNRLIDKMKMWCLISGGAATAMSVYAILQLISMPVFAMRPGIGIYISIAAGSVILALTYFPKDQNSETKSDSTSSTEI